MSETQHEPYLADEELLAEFHGEDVDLARRFLALRLAPSEALRVRVSAITAEAADASLTPARGDDLAGTHSDEQEGSLLTWRVSDDSGAAASPATESDTTGRLTSATGARMGHRDGRRRMPAHWGMARQLAALAALVLFAAGLGFVFREWLHERAPRTARAEPDEQVLAALDAGSQNLEFVGQLGGYPGGLAIQGSYAYLGVGMDFVILDVSTPARPTRTGALMLPGAVNGIALNGSLAYVMAGESGLWIIDVSSPDAPSIVSRYDTLGYAGSITLAEHADDPDQLYAYVSTGDGVRILDLRDPAAPTEIGSYEADGLFDVAVAGRYAYLALDRAGLTVLDLVDPTRPAEVGSFRGLQADSIVVADGYAYVAGMNGHLTILDVSDPAAPVELGSLQRPGPDGEPRDVLGMSLTVAGRYAYLVEGPSFSFNDEVPLRLAPVGGGLRVVDISDPSNPQEAGFVPGRGIRLQVADGRGYLTAADGLHILDLAAPQAPEEIGFYEMMGWATGVAVVGNHAYVAAGARLRVIDIADRAAPREVGAIDVAGGAHRVAVSGRYAYVAAGYAGLRVIDVSVPAAPIEVGSLDTPGTTENLVVAGQYVYLADYAGGLIIADVSNPAAPVAVGHYEAPKPVRDVPIAGEAPKPVRDVAIAGPYAYVAWGNCGKTPGCNGGLRILDISDPTAPVEIGHYDLPRYVEDLAVADGYVYLAVDTEALLIVDVSEPSAPTLAGIYKSGVADGVTVAGDRAYLNEGWPIVTVLDISNPAAPVEVGLRPIPSIVEEIAAAGDDVYVVDIHAGLVILEFTGPKAAPTPSPSPPPTGEPGETQAGAFWDGGAFAGRPVYSSDDGMSKQAHDLLAACGISDEIVEDLVRRFWKQPEDDTRRLDPETLNAMQELLWTRVIAIIEVAPAVFEISCQGQHP